MKVTNCSTCLGALAARDQTIMDGRIITNTNITTITAIKQRVEVTTIFQDAKQFSMNERTVFKPRFCTLGLYWVWENLG